MIREKLDGCISNVSLYEEAQSRNYAEHKLRSYRERIESVATPNDLMVLEAAAAQTYFKLWQELPIRWHPKSVDKVPPDWLAYEQRQSKVSKINRHASHPVNAILNYAYAVLESQVRIAAAMIGFDTGLAYLHAMKHGRSSLIYDFVEPLRPRLNRRLIGFVQETSFTKDDFTLSIQGVCKLNPHLAQRIVAIALSDPEVQISATGFRDGLLDPMQLDAKQQVLAELFSLLPQISLGGLTRLDVPWSRAQLPSTLGRKGNPNSGERSDSRTSPRY